MTVEATWIGEILTLVETFNGREDEKTIIPLPGVGYVTLAYDIRCLGSGFRASYIEIGCGAHTWVRSEASEGTYPNCSHPPDLVALYETLTGILAHYHAERRYR